METIELINKIGDASVVKSQRGSWKWQDAYRVSRYKAVAKYDGTLILKSYHKSGKYSYPQLARINFAGIDNFGSLQNKVVKMDYAAKVIGWRGVQVLLDHGFSFDC